MVDAHQIKAATLVAHGNGDFNVMTKQAAQRCDLTEATASRTCSTSIRRPGGSSTDFLTNLWFTRYLWRSQERRRERREVLGCAGGGTSAARDTVVGDHANTATLTVASNAPFRVATRSRSADEHGRHDHEHDRLITNVTGNTLTLATAVATAAGRARRRSRDGQPSPARRQPDALREWPDPATSTAVVRLRPALRGRGHVTLRHRRGRRRRLSTTPCDRHACAQRGVLQRPPALREPVLTDNVRISGTPTVSLTRVQQAEGETSPYTSSASRKPVVERS